MRHWDFFSGIGGFSYAADKVWKNTAHTFVEIDPFCQQVLKKHWPKSKVYGDIRTITNTTIEGGERVGLERQSKQKATKAIHADLLTGGFPCQPFSQAGRKKGTADNRFLWPEMLRCIQLLRPTWVIAENVRGILTIEQGMVFEQVCSDLEGEGYEVQPFIIPAVSLDAPHRRDRIWFIANAIHNRQGQAKQRINAPSDSLSQEHRTKDGTTRKFERTDSDRPIKKYASDTTSARLSQSREARSASITRSASRRRFTHDDRWDKNWPEVAAELCGLDDGLPAELGDFKISKSRHRKEQLKAYGNSIVPQVAIEIMRAIKYAGLK